MIILEDFSNNNSLFLFFRPAFEVKIHDDNFPSDKFEYIQGFPTSKWPKLSPSSNVSHIAIVRPKFSGSFNFTHATVSYIANERSKRVQVGYSTELGEAFVLKLKDYNRRFASHLVKICFKSII
jgi:translocon-associated protein subunit beta